MLQDFKVQVQEWKNVLLRGKDSAQRERYWAAFQKQERIVVQDASQLLDEAAELIAKASADTASQAATLSLIVMLAVCAASVVVGAAVQPVGGVLHRAGCAGVAGRGQRRFDRGSPLCRAR